MAGSSGRLTVSTQPKKLGGVVRGASPCGRRVAMGEAALSEELATALALALAKPPSTRKLISEFWLVIGNLLSTNSLMTR